MKFTPLLAAALAVCASATTTLLVQCGDPGSEAPAPAHLAAFQAPLGEPIRFLISGSMLGRLEPCGCASGQLGGLPRRMQHIGERRNYDVLIEGGDLVETATELDVQKLFTAVQILFGMQRPYDALGVGKNDLLLPLDEWCAFLAGAPVVASDIECSREDWPARPFLEKEVRGTPVRIASLTLALPEGLRNDEGFRLLGPAEAWKRALTGASDGALRILLVQGTGNEARALVPRLEPAPTLVVCCDHDYVEPSAHPERVGEVPMVFAGIRGRVMLELTVQPTTEGSPRIACELVPLAGSKTIPGGGGDPDVKAALLSHREQVKQDSVLEHMARQLPTPNGASYLGSETCGGCHPSAMQAWSKSKHSMAWDTLVKAEKDPQRYGWPVTHYPDCVGCHVVGYREKTGFVSFDETPQLAAVGCERCHGPGSEHMMNPAANKLGIIGGLAASVMCTTCHDFEQSPDFLYGDRWKLIEHGREPHMQKPR
jgi:hypothetical protein